MQQLQTALQHYTQLIETLETKNNHPKKVHATAIKTLLSRDHIEEIVSKKAQNSLKEEYLEEFLKLTELLEQLDKRLNKLGSHIATYVNLGTFHEKVANDTNSWWWQFQKKPSKLERFNWFFNLLTMVILAITASFMINIYSAVSMSNATFGVALSTIAQGLGLAALGGGALSSKGQAIVKRVLSSFGIASKYFAITTLFLATLFLALLYNFDQRLDSHYYHKGLQAYEKGQLSNAKQFFLQGQAINPTSTLFNTQLGKVHESLGDLASASKYYRESITEGHIDDFNGLGRVYINLVNPTTTKKNFALAESYLLLGMQRLQTKQQNSKEIQSMLYNFRTTIAWALLEQKKYTRANAYLSTAIADYEKSTFLKKESNALAYCFMAQTKEVLKESQKANAYWLQCLEHAKPEFIHQLNWFIAQKKDKIAYCLDTSNVVSGYTGTRNKVAKSFCTNVKKELKAPLL